MKHYFIEPIVKNNFEIKSWTAWYKNIIQVLDNQLNSFYSYRQWFNPNYYILNQDRWVTRDNEIKGVRFLEDISERLIIHTITSGGIDYDFYDVSGLNFHEGVINNFENQHNTYAVWTWNSAWNLDDALQNSYKWEPSYTIVSLASWEAAKPNIEAIKEDPNNYLIIPLGGGAGSYYFNIPDTSVNMHLQYWPKATDLYGQIAIVNLNTQLSRFYWADSTPNVYKGLYPYEIANNRQRVLLNIVAANSINNLFIKDKNLNWWTGNIPLEDVWVLTTNGYSTAQTYQEEDFFIERTAQIDLTKIANTAICSYNITVNKDPTISLPSNLYIKLH